MFKSYNENVHFIEQKCSICKAKIRTNGNIGKLMPAFLLACPPRGDARKPFLRARVYAKNTPKNYTYPALIDLITWYLVRLIVYSLCSQPSTSDGLTRHGMPVLSARHFSFPQDSFCFPQDSFCFQQDSFCIQQDSFYYQQDSFCFQQDSFYYQQDSFYYLRRNSLLQTL